MRIEASDVDLGRRIYDRVAPLDDRIRIASTPKSPRTNTARRQPGSGRRAAAWFASSASFPNE